jgi:hypothetical protein
VPWAALPTTTASIQRFAAHEYDASELGPSRFSVASVHRVGILDVCLLNIDRHADNILVKKSPESKCASGDSTPTPLDFLYGSGIAKSVSFSAAVPQPAPLPPHPAASSLPAGLPREEEKRRVRERGREID